MRLLGIFYSLALIFTLTACASKASRAGASDISDIVGEGYPPEKLELLDEQGRMAHLGRLQGKVLLIDYFTTYAQPSQYLTPIYDELYRKYKDRGFMVIGVSLDVQGWTMLEPFIETFGLSYPIYLSAENGQEVRTPFGGYLQEVPTAILVDRDGRMVKGYIGVTDLKRLEKDILKQIEAK